MRDTKFYEGTDKGIFYQKAVASTGKTIDVGDFRNAIFTLSSQTSANFTIKFQGSCSETAPDFSASKSATNKWEYLQVKDRQNDTGINGSTGVAFAGTDDVRILEANMNGVKWLSATITARSAGSVNLDVVLFDNN
jgi:hypothetical protein